MPLPIARVGDLHVCPMSTGPVPHVGGPVLPPGGIRILMGDRPAARVGDEVACIGPVDAVASGSTRVLIAGRPAARMGDRTAHGGVIITGYPAVLIG